METVLSPKLLEEIKRTTERRMAFCGTCGVGIGLMTQAEFDHRYSQQCPICRGKTTPTPAKEEKSLFSPEIREYVTPKLLFGVLREIFAERREA